MTCLVPGCGRPTRSPKAELCNAHYFRVYRTGTVGSAPIRTEAGKCSVDDCERKLYARTYCQLHDRRVLKGGHPNYVGTQEWDKNPSWKADGQIGYVAAHDRVASQRGPAHAQRCVECSCQARHWAYQHTDPNELTTPNGIPYSNDPAHYRPLCVPCHKRFDLTRRNSETGGGTRR